jgi:hypothetical protein
MNLRQFIIDDNVVRVTIVKEHHTNSAAFHPLIISVQNNESFSSVLVSKDS